MGSVWNEDPGSAGRQMGSVWNEDTEGAGRQMGSVRNEDPESAGRQMGSEVGFHRPDRARNIKIQNS